MTDFRLTPDPSLVSQDEPGQIITPVTDLCRVPGGQRDRQAIYGDHLTVLAKMDGWSYVQLGKDGYCGYVSTRSIGAQVQPTHTVSAPATHAYLKPDFKSPDQISLSFGSQIRVLGYQDNFARTALGYIPMQHLNPVGTVASDLGNVAEQFLGTPYLWGGNSRWGIDCSGLVQAACLACRIACPGDSDHQLQQLGTHLPPGNDFKRGDFLCWKGHIALVLEPDLLIHANAHKMAVTLEPISAAIERIAKTDGAMTGHKRIASSKWP
ncbi:Cell wall-associated hydrolase, NlpC family [Sulfitobacter marinus]|uniref:Cell wall-associated hydrolase, NlpC family n=1 Tax=Sulfitobacter marinus TaxID=394264 RepID=A0A1I6TI29_9RHOB|nr:NlpC/P60 family protein [Sulfitobacter marinus]SFS88873.1 Cell wall-associated hydrolase, NlpC family [Sulfitobacter marinus]